ncbi:phosphoglycerate kinase [Clostridiaceae bacterium HSG29]|nr:phosphoglycerate kinase [Clostridiaceae bacterium HSG29]
MMLNKKTVEDININGKKVLVRCDFNVPLNDKFEITDESRIEGALPTIKYLLENNAKVILCSHLGRPKGEAKKEFSLAPVAKRLDEILDTKVIFAADDEVVGTNAKEATNNMENGEVVLLENTRYRKEEKKNEEEFAKELASLADVYVNDAFGTAHRAHASTEGVTKFMDESASGYLIQKEIKFLGNAVETPERPFVAILGGAKVSDKIAVIENLLDKVDSILIGGGMAYTFLKAQGYTIGNSLVEEDRLDYALKMIEQAKAKNVKFVIPVDHIVGAEFSKDTEPIVTEDQNIEDGYMGLDIGPKTADLFKDIIKDAKTIIWNGPMGVFEFENFANGTISVASEMANTDAITIIGGGDSATAVNTLGFGDKMSHISTGGGASLVFLEGKELPGIMALDNK